MSVYTVIVLTYLWLHFYARLNLKLSFHTSLSPYPFKSLYQESVIKYISWHIIGIDIVTVTQLQLKLYTIIICVHLLCVVIILWLLVGN